MTCTGTHPEFDFKSFSESFLQEKAPNCKADKARPSSAKFKGGLHPNMPSCLTQGCNLDCICYSSDLIVCYSTQSPPQLIYIYICHRVGQALLFSVDRSPSFVLSTIDSSTLRGLL